jgi:hypothetical protein
MSASFVYKVFICRTSDPQIDDSVEKIVANEVIQLNVLNACGERGIAGEIKKYLHARGFDVVEIGNFNVEADKSYIIDRVGDKSSASKVAFSLGIDDSLIVKKIDSSLFVRCSVILGKDFRQLKPYR